MRNKKFARRQFFRFFVYILMVLSCSNVYAQEKAHFDPQQVAKEEVAAWKDYYDNDFAGLVQHLAQLIVVEFRINQLTAWKTVVPELIAAATIFRNLPESSPRTNYESNVLPHLTAAYEAIREALQGTWDPYEAALTELDWWIERRLPSASNPEIAGKRIADLYSLIYGKQDDHHFARAGYLRAVAARYRDLSHKEWYSLEEEDWNIIENILQLSYEEVLLGIEANKRV